MKTNKSIRLVQKLLSTQRLVQGNGHPLSLRKFAKAVGVSHQTIKLWESGKATPLPQVLSRIANDASESWARELGKRCFTLLYSNMIND